MENKEITQQPTSFETAQREAKALSSSDLVPQQYKGNVANTLVALEIAHRIGASPLMVMQNLHIIHGRPSWSSTFVIAAINGFNQSVREAVAVMGGRFFCKQHKLIEICNTFEHLATM